MLSYETTLFNKLRAARMADQPGTFIHGRDATRRTYRLLSGPGDRLEYSELRYDSRIRRWEVVQPYGALRYCRAGELATTTWRSLGGPNVALFQTLGWPYSRMTAGHQDDDRTRFTTKTIPLTTYASVLRYYPHDYAQVQGFGFYHLHGDVAKIGVPAFPDVSLTLSFGLVPSGAGDPRPYTFGIWIGLNPHAAKSPYSLDKDLTFLARG